MKAWIAITAAILVTTAVGAASMYVVPVYDFAIVTQFGRVVDEVKEPGLKFK